MGRYIRWQAIITFAGIALTLAFILFLSLSRTTITVPDVGGTYTEGLAGSPQFINPLLAHFNPVDQDLSALIFNGLTRLNSNGKLEADLAESWEISEDGLVYLFKLKQNIRWQDGAAFDADDVLFTIALMQDPEFPGVPYLQQLWASVIVEKLDDYTVRFTLTEPFPAFADFTTIGILPAHKLPGVAARELLNHPFNLQPVGTGPFKLNTVNTQLAQLSANPYYAAGKPRLARLDFRFYPSQQAVITAYENGQVQGIASIAPDLLAGAASLSDLNLYSARLAGYSIIYLNLQAPNIAPFFQEKEVRQALLTALNRQEIIDQALNGQGLAAYSPIMAWNWAYNPEQATAQYSPEQAKTRLDEKGWIDNNGDGVRDKNGIPLAFHLLVSDEPSNIKVAETVAAQWQVIGVQATVEVVGASLGERLVTHNYQAALAELRLAGDPDPYALWHQAQIEGGQNYAGWIHAEASKLLEAGRSTTDQGQRRGYYAGFQRIFAEEVPSLILFNPVYTYGVQNSVHNVQLAPLTSPADRFKTVRDWYVLTRRIIYSESQFD